MRRIVVAIGLVACIATLGCQPRTRTTTGESTGTTSGDTAAMRRDTTAAGERLRQLSAEVDSLAARAGHADAKLRASINEQRAHLRPERDSTALGLERLKRTGAEGWDRAKVATDSLLGTLDRGLQDARQRLRASRDTTRH